MTNVQQNPNQKTQDDRYPNQSGKTNPQDNQNRDHSKQDQSSRKDAPDANRQDGMKGEPTNRDPRREEEDRPRAEKKNA